MEEIPEEKMDSIDTELNTLLDECLSGADSEEDFGEASELLMDIFSYLIDEGTVEDPPEEDASDEIKKSWIEKSMPIIRNAMKDALQTGSE